MRVDLTDEQARALLDALDRDLSDMRAEIEHTDNPRFRRELRDRRDRLEEVRRAVQLSAQHPVQPAPQ